jgi:hypothetical protein
MLLSSPLKVGLASGSRDRSRECAAIKPPGSWPRPVLYLCILYSGRAARATDSATERCLRFLRGFSRPLCRREDACCRASQPWPFLVSCIRPINAWQKDLIVLDEAQQVQDLVPVQGVEVRVLSSALQEGRELPDLKLIPGPREGKRSGAAGEMLQGLILVHGRGDE